MVNPLLSTRADFYNTYSPNREGDLHRTLFIATSRHIVMQYEYFSCEKCQVHLYPSYYLINKRACLGICDWIYHLRGDREFQGSRQLIVHFFSPTAKMTGSVTESPGCDCGASSRLSPVYLQRLSQTFSTAAHWSVCQGASDRVWTDGTEPHAKETPLTQWTLKKTNTNLTFLSLMSNPSRSTLDFAGCSIKVSF